MRSPFHFFRYLSDKLPINYPELVLNELVNLHERFANPLRVLDIGAGPGHYWKGDKLSSFLITTNSELTLFDASSEFDSEVFPPGMLVDRKLGIVPESLKLIPDDYFDYVLAIDLIEHLSKSDGYLFLYELDRISKGSSALLTPNGFAWQPPSINNIYNAHISGWTIKEFKQLGWKSVRGQVGFKKLYGPYALQKYKGTSRLILESIAALKIISFLFPTQSFSIFASKSTKNPRIKIHE